MNYGVLFFCDRITKKGVIMKVSAITNYQIQPQKINGTKKHAYSNHAQQNVQPSFKSGKGAFWGLQEDFGEKMRICPCREEQPQDDAGGNQDTV